MAGSSIGLVLGAGGIVGAAYHAGTLAALYEVTGWDPRHAEVVVGTSAGSGIGTSLAAGLSPRDMLARATGTAMSEHGRAVVGADPGMIDLPLRPSLGDRPYRPAAPHLLANTIMRPWQARGRAGSALAGLLPAGSVPTAPIGDRVRAMYRVRWPDRPLWICAVRLRDGRRVVFGRDEVEAPDVGAAVEASSAIPGFFRPVRIGDDDYVDGGAHSPTNADLLAGLGLDAVVIISPMSAARGSLRLTIGMSARLASGWSLAREVKLLRDGGTPVLTAQPTAADLDAMGPNAMDPRRRADVARRAHTSGLARFARPDASGLFADLT